MTSLANSQDQFQSDDVRVVIRRKSNCCVELDVFASLSLAVKARKAAIKLVGKEISVPGFRPGKAPEEMIVKKHPGAIDKEQANQLANLAYAEAQKLAKVPLLNNNASISFDVKERTDTETHLVFSFETEPSVPSVDVKRFVASDVKRAEVGEKQIEEAIRQMRFYYATWTPVTERGVQEGDYVLINLDTIDGDVAQNVFNHIRFEVSSERMADWMRRLILGAKAGEVLSGVSEPDATASEEEKKEFQPKNVRVTLIKVEEATLPELNSDFTVKVGAADVDALRTSVRQILDARADEGVHEALANQVNEFLVREYHFELPASLLNAEVQHRLEQVAKAPDSKEKWDKMSREEREKLESKIRQEAEEAIRLFYLSRQVVKDANIPVTHKEVEQEAVLLTRGQRSGEISQSVFALALSKVLLAKAQNHILKMRES